MNTNATMLISFEADNTLRISCKNASGTAILLMYSTNTYTADATWHHFAASVDMTDTGKRHIYIDNSDDLGTVTTYTNEDIDWIESDFTVRANPLASDKINGCLSEIWLSNEYLDLSVAGNRAKLISGGKPVDLGSDGSTPTGTSPLVYLPNPYTSFETNAGTGGNFTVTGAFSACANSPSD
mgnify:CR=1 FL=1